MTILLDTDQNPDREADFVDYLLMSEVDAMSSAPLSKPSSPPEKPPDGAATISSLRPAVEEGSQLLSSCLAPI